MDGELRHYEGEIKAWSVIRLTSEVRRLEKARSAWYEVRSNLGVGADQIKLAEEMLVLVRKQLEAVKELDRGQDDDSQAVS